MKITIYELLGLIKDGKQPSKIKFCGNIYEWDEERKFYLTQKKSYKVFLGGSKEDINILFNAFNDNVEIIGEDEEIEFENIRELTQECFDDWTEAKKINSLIKNQKKLIDEVNKLKGKYE